MGSVPGMNASCGPISTGLIVPGSTSVGEVLLDGTDDIVRRPPTHSDGPGPVNHPDPVHTPDEIQRMKRELMKIRDFASIALGCAFSTPIDEMADGLLELKNIREDLTRDLKRADEQVDELMRNHEAMKTRLDHAAHAAYRLAALACDVTGADARAVRSAAERCCDKGDKSDKPEGPRREYREGEWPRKKRT